MWFFSSSLQVASAGRPGTGTGRLLPALLQLPSLHGPVGLALSSTRGCSERVAPLSQKPPGQDSCSILENCRI